MIPARTAGRNRGTRVQTPAFPAPVRSSGSAAHAAACLALLVALVAVLSAACGPSGPTGSASAASPSAGAASPGSSTGGGAPRATPWPGDAVLGIEALGIADGNIGAATTDLGKGIANEDLALMRMAAAGLAGVDVLLPNMTKIRLEPGMRPFADGYEAAITQISAGGKALRDAIDKGDAPAIATSTQDLLNGLKLYAALQGELAAWIQQMPEQKRMLTQ